MDRHEDSTSLQDRFSPHGHCFGCGPESDGGLRLRTFASGDEVVCTWTPEARYQAFEGFLNGGVCGILLDCNSAWAAAYELVRTRGLERAPAVVTADLQVKFKRPTPITGPLEIRARAVETSGDRITVEATLSAAGVVTATCRSTFVAVAKNHPAYDRW